MKKTSFHFHEAYGYQTWREVASKERCYPQSHKFCWSSVRIRSTWWLSKRDHLPYWSYCPTATWRIRYVISLLYFYKAHGISDGLYNGSPRTNSHVSLITWSYVVSWKLGKRYISKAKRNNTSVSARERKKLNTKLHTSSMLRFEIFCWYF